MNQLLNGARLGEIERGEPFVGPLNEVYEVGLISVSLEPIGLPIASEQQE